MTTWCLVNNFTAPPINFPAPKPLTNCSVTFSEYCSSKAVASSCGVR